MLLIAAGSLEIPLVLETFLTTLAHSRASSFVGKDVGFISHSRSGPPDGPGLALIGLEVHAACRHRRERYILLRLLGDHCLGGNQ